MNYFTSWAQNNEDVLLWRVLKHVKCGFYIDVGANDPDEHSVTRAFYERGWHGINIEPLPQFHAVFETDRPRDINLSMAAGSADGELTLYDVPDVRGWASPDSTVAQAHQAAGYRIAELTVPVRRLDGICAEHVHGPIHFLKVDVEGFEGDVLRGMDFVRFRPWIVVVEATLPGSTECNHGEWEHLLLEQGYLFGHFDGLNRYYVAEEQKHLLPKLAVPVNVFDEYLSIHLVRAWERLEQAAQQLEQANTSAQLVEQRVQTLSAYQQHAIQEIAHLAQSLANSENRRIGIVLHCYQQEQEIAALQARLADTTARLADTDNRLANTHARLETEFARANAAQAYIAAVYASSSWRLTAPLRHAVNLPMHTRHWLLLQRDKVLRLRDRLIRLRDKIRNLSRLPLRHHLHTLARPLLWFVRNPTVRAILLPLLEKFPQFRKRLKQTVAVVRQDAGPPPVAPQELDLPDEMRDLPVSTRKILADLNRYSV